MMTQRIITVLFSLAALLERAAHAPRPVRWLVVRLLAPLEPMIRHFVLQTGWACGAISVMLPDPLPQRWRASPAVAFQLSDCFYALARALESLPRQLYERWRTCESLQPALRDIMKRLARLGSLPAPLAATSVSFIDTS